MSALLICFSQTGNTRKIANYIGEGITAENGGCDLISLKDADPGAFSNYDLIGLGAPVFYYQEPFNVQEFLQQLPDQKGRHWFVFCTHGNIIGNFFPSVAEKLRAKGAIVVGYHNSYADITVPFYPRPSYTSGHPDGQDFAEAGKFGREVVRLSARITGPDSPLIPQPGPISSKKWIDSSKELTREYISNGLPKLHWDEDKCDGCEICVQECPVDGISVDAQAPRLQEPCIFCLRCVSVCPNFAINADWSEIIENAPATYQAYREELDQVAARGDFRWLVEPDQIDVGKPWHLERQHNKDRAE